MNEVSEKKTNIDIFGILLPLIVWVLLCPNYAVSDELATFALLERKANCRTASLKCPHSTIRMEAEHVTIRMLSGFASKIDAVFHFFNTGETTTEWVGLEKRGNKPIPIWVNGTKIELDEELEEAQEPDIPLSHGLPHKADRQIGELKPASRVETMKPTKRWMAQRITFPGHAGITIRTVYGARGMGDGPIIAYYDAWTGKCWENDIRKVVFNIDASEVGGVRGIQKVLSQIAPGPRFIGKHLMRFEMENVKSSPGTHVFVILWTSSSPAAHGGYDEP